MKKFFVIALAVAMMMTMAATAFAESIDKDGSNASIAVKGNYAIDSTAGDSISVTIEWEKMEFTYTAASRYGTAAGSWSTDKSTITVKNHSNVAVTVTLAWTQNTDIAGTINGTFSGDDVKNNVMELASADDDAYRSTDPDVVPAAPTVTAQFGISGDAIDKDYATLGTITITIAKKA